MAIAPAGPLSTTMDEDGAPAGWAAPAVTASDADGDLLTWSLASAPLHGTAAVSGGGASPAVFSYSPAAQSTVSSSAWLQVGNSAPAIAPAADIWPTRAVCVATG